MDTKTVKETFSRAVIKKVTDMLPYCPLLSDEVAEWSPEERYLAMVASTPFAQYTMKKHTRYDKVIQKDIKTILVPSEIDYKASEHFFNMIRELHTTTAEYDEYVDNKHIMQTIYKVFSIVYLESVYSLKKEVLKHGERELSFGEHILNEEFFLKEDIKATYKSLKDTYGTIRNYLLLFAIHYPALKDMYDYSGYLYIKKPIGKK